MEVGIFDLRGVFNLLRRHFVVILATIAVVMAITTVTLFTLKPVYTATTLVLVDPSRKDLLNPEAAGMEAWSDTARVDGEVELVGSETTLLRVVTDEKLVEDREFGPRIGMLATILGYLRIAEPKLPSGEEALQAVMGQLSSALSVQRRGLTYLVGISVRSQTPRTAARVANAVARAYIDEQLDSKVQSTLASRDIIQSRISEASDALANTERAFDTFVSSNIDSISQQTGRTDLVDLRRQLDALNEARGQQSVVAELVDGGLRNRDWQAVADNLKSQALASLEQQRRRISQSLATAVEGSQSAIDLRSQLSALEGQLETRATTELASLRESITASGAQASELRGQLRTTLLNSELPAEVLTSIYELQQSSEIARTQYQTLLSRLSDLEAQAYLQVADSRIVSEALTPSSPSFPNTRLIFGLAGLAAVALAIGLAFLVENFIGGFTNEEHLASLTKTNVAAVVPRQKDKRGGSGEPTGVADRVIDAPLSIYAEAIRRIRLAIEQSLMKAQNEVKRPAGMGEVVMVASAVPKEGKTTIALSLARALALSGRMTLLIDCDLRKPGVHSQLGLEPSGGLLEYLSNPDDTLPLASIVVVDESSGARIVVGSHRSNVPTDQLLSGVRFQRLLDAARRSFDVVILDTPPLGPVVDGLYLARHADAIAFVVRWTSTSQQEVRNAIRALQGAKRPEVDVVTVLNRKEVLRQAYAGKYAGYYSEA